MNRYGIVLVKLFTSAGLLGLVFQQFNVAESLEVMTRIGFGSVAAVLLIGAAQAVLHVLRWQLVARSLGTELHFRLLMRLTSPTAEISKTSKRPLLHDHNSRAFGLTSEGFTQFVKNAERIFVGEFTDWNKISMARE